MLLVSGRKLFLFFISSLILILGCGILGYYWLYPGYEAPIDPKLAAERLLYFALVGVLFLSIYFIHIYRYRIQVEKKLKRITSLGGIASPALRLKSEKLGSLGETLEHLYRHVMQVNTQQSLKLSGQSELISILLGRWDAPLAVTDVTGTILYTSEKYEKRTDSVKAKLIGASIETVEEDVIVPLIMQEVESQRSYSGEGNKENTKKKNSYTVFPIFNSRGSIHYLLFDFQTSSPFRHRNT